MADEIGRRNVALIRRAREVVEVAGAYARLPARTRATVRGLLRQLAGPADADEQEIG